MHACASVCGWANACACARIALLTQHATRMRHIAICDLWLHQIFRHYLINGMNFEKKERISQLQYFCNTTPYSLVDCVPRFGRNVCVHIRSIWQQVSPTRRGDLPHCTSSRVHGNCTWNLKPDSNIAFSTALSGLYSHWVIKYFKLTRGVQICKGNNPVTWSLVTQQPREWIPMAQFN